MAKDLPMLATREEIQSLAERAFTQLDLLHAPLGPEDDEEEAYEARRRDSPALRAAIEALRFCATAASLLRDPELLPLVVRILHALLRWQSEDHTDSAPVYEGLHLVLRAGAPVDSEFERLARHRDPKIRAAIAKGLSPQNPRSLALLEKLSRDPVASVRRDASTILSTAREVPWWAGKFKEDPLTRLDSAEAAQHKSTFEKIHALLEDPFGKTPDKLSELAELAAPLSDTLVVELCEMTLSASMDYLRWAPRLGTLMICRPGGLEALLRLCKIWCRDEEFADREDARFLIDAPIDTRRSVCDALIRHAAAAPKRERYDMDTTAFMAACLASRAYPPGADLRLLLDTLLALPEPTRGSDFDYVFHELHEALLDKDADPNSILDALVEARCKGCPGPWKRLERAVNALLDKASPAAQRTIAEDAIRREDPATVIWGIKKLLGEAHDPSRDPAPLEMARRFFADARYRKHIWEDYDLCAMLVSELRVLLRQGELDFQKAARAMHAISRLWGGMNRYNRLPGDTSVEVLEKELREERAPFEAFLGSEELWGPITEAEWRELRRTRDHVTLEDRATLFTAFSTLPDGPLLPEDRPVVEAMVAYCEKEDRHETLSVAISLSVHATVEDLPLFDRLLACCTEQRDVLLTYLDQTLAELGLPPLPPRQANATEWMDEDEDEDDEEDL